MTLSPREREVVVLLGDGSDRTCREGAEMLGISIHTMRRHIERIARRNPSTKRPRALIRDLYGDIGASALSTKPV